MNDLSKEAIQEIAALTRKAGAGFQIIDENELSSALGSPLVLIPDGMKLESLSGFEAPEPATTAHFDEAPSFIDYVNRFKDARTLISCETAANRFVACIDYFNAAKGGKMAYCSVNDCQHFAILTLEHSAELKSWKKVFNTWIPQDELAEWLEDHVHHVTIPTPADVLTLAKEMEAIQDVAVANKQRNNDGGWNIEYKDETKGHLGEIEIPGKITITIPLYYAGGALNIECLFRFKVGPGKLLFLLRPVRLEEEIRAAVQLTREKIAEQTALTVCSGKVFEKKLNPVREASRGY